MKKQILIIAITLVLLIVGFSGCIEEENGNNNGEMSDQLSDLGYKQYGFGLNPPEEFVYHHPINKIGSTEEYWYVNESVPGYEVRFELVNSSLNKLNVSLLISRIGLINSSLEDFASENLQNWYDMFNATNISNTTTKVNGMNAYTTAFNGLLWNETEYRLKYVYLEKNRIAFNIIYLAEKNLYDEYIDSVNDSIDSFTIQ